MEENNNNELQELDDKLRNELCVLWQEIQPLQIKLDKLKMTHEFLANKRYEVQKQIVDIQVLRPALKQQAQHRIKTQLEREIKALSGMQKGQLLAALEGLLPA